MVAGVIYLALGLKKVAQYVGDEHHHALTDPLPTTALWALYGGVAAYLLGHLGVPAAQHRIDQPAAGRRRRRCCCWRRWPSAGAGARPRWRCSPASSSALIAFEVVRYAEARAAVRAELAQH